MTTKIQLIKNALRNLATNGNYRNVSVGAIRKYFAKNKLGTLSDAQFYVIRRDLALEANPPSESQFQLTVNENQSEVQAFPVVTVTESPVQPSVSDTLVSLKSILNRLGKEEVHKLVDLLG